MSISGVSFSTTAGVSGLSDGELGGATSFGSGVDPVSDESVSEEEALTVADESTVGVVTSVAFGTVRSTSVGTDCGRRSTVLPLDARGAFTEKACTFRAFVRSGASNSPALWN
jgi:hypothetical protein